MAALASCSTQQRVRRHHFRNVEADACRNQDQQRLINTLKLLQRKRRSICVKSAPFLRKPLQLQPRFSSGDIRLSKKSAFSFHTPHTNHISISCQLGQLSNLSGKKWRDTRPAKTPFNSLTTSRCRRGLSERLPPIAPDRYERRMHDGCTKGDSSCLPFALGSRSAPLKPKEVQMQYVDGYVLPVPKKKLKAYLRMARMGEKAWRKHGALDYKECVGDDLKTKWGMPFARMMKLKAGETVVFAYVVFKSRTHRDRVNAKVMQEMANVVPPKDMPFDMKRMVYGGFKASVGG